jgi:hypothetical protein
MQGKPADRGLCRADDDGRRSANTHFFQELPMKENQERQADALRRVQGFILTHAAVLGGIASLEGRTQVDEALAAIDGLTNNQQSATRFIAGQLNRQQTLMQKLVQEHLVPVARFARAKLSGVPDFKALTPALNQNRIALLLVSAKATATAVEKYAADYVTGGFPADQAQQINGLVDEIMKSQAERAKLRGGRVNATREIAAGMKKGMLGVRHLDAVIIKQFASNPGLLAEWRSASRVWEKTGVSRKPSSVAPKPAEAESVEV